MGSATSLVSSGVVVRTVLFCTVQPFTAGMLGAPASCISLPWRQ